MKTIINDLVGLEWLLISIGVYLVFLIGGGIFIGWILWRSDTQYNKKNRL
ncbi:MAG: hypothetical protein LBU84_05515 [Prevotella sp.]|jgi:uncharacterized membrane protein AbrB (regulator of aidB expression)|nr:hypothetical protein [Prevotella sp.]